MSTVVDTFFWFFPPGCLGADILTTVVGTGARVAGLNHEWAKAITALLDKHKLTLRGAALKADRPSLRTYLSEWMSGRVPQYNTALDFLSHFPREEAIECLKAGGFPIPEDWREQSSDPIDAVRIALRANRNLSDASKTAILDFVREMQEKDKLGDGRP